MKLADSNFWLALALSKHVFHDAVKTWLGAETQAEQVLFCRATQQSFLRLLTTSAVLVPYGIPPLENRAAWSAYEAFLADKRIAWVDEPPGLDLLWKRLTGASKASPKLWMDAYLAAFAMAGRYQMVTTDKTFEQFKGARSPRVAGRPRVVSFKSFLVALFGRCSACNLVDLVLNLGGGRSVPVRGFNFALKELLGFAAAASRAAACEPFFSRILAISARQKAAARRA